MTKCGETTNIQSKKFKIELLDNENKHHKIEVFTVDQAPGWSTKIENYQENKVAKIFKIPPTQKSNVEGEIGLIIGIEHFNISPLKSIVKEHG